MPKNNLSFVSRNLFIYLILFTLLWINGCGNKNDADKQAAPPPGVLVEQITLKEIQDNVEFIGRTVAINDVALKAQVSGYLQETLFSEGADVNKGEELFILEPEFYQANVAAARANLAKAEADQTRAEKDLVRYKQLLKTKNISQQQVDVTQSEVLQTKAQVQIATAELQKAELDLSYTRIKSPINGRIGRTVVSVGNLIGPQTEILARIVEVDPIYVTFNVAEADLIKVKREVRPKLDDFSDLTNPQRIKQSAVKIRLILPDNSEYSETGHVDFVDNAVDPKTGTIIVRAKFSNPDDYLVPGLYVRTILYGNESQSNLMVHASAVQEDQAGEFVMVVDHDNKVDMRRIKTGRQFGGDRVVLDGLNPDERVIVEGIQKVRPGMVVEPKLAILPGDESKLEQKQGAGSKTAEGSLPKDAQGSLPKDAEGSLPKDAEGSGSQDTEGSGSQDAEGSDSKAAEGSGSKAAEGSLSKTAEGSDSKDAEGSGSQDAEGSLSKDAEGSGSQDAEGSDSVSNISGSVDNDTQKEQ